MLQGHKMRKEQQLKENKQQEEFVKRLEVVEIEKHNLKMQLDAAYQEIDSLKNQLDSFKSKMEQI